MAQQDERTDILGGLFGRKPEKAEKPKNEKETITARKTIISLIQVAITDGSAVRVALTGDQTNYFSFFALDDKGGSPHIDQGTFLLLAPLDPPIGNLRIRRAPLVSLNFFSSQFVAETKVRFQQSRTDRNLELSFPLEVTYSKQNRLAPRFKMHPGIKYRLTVTRPSGVSFEGVIIDISTGGMAFYSKSQSVARLDEGATVALEITRGGMERTIHVDAKVLGGLQKDGQPCFRAQFKIKSQEALVLIKRFVDHVAKEQLAQRDKLFNS